MGVESAEGTGSTFWFTATFAKQPESRPPRRALPRSLQGAKVLVLDDNATSRSLIAKRLRAWNCRPEEIADVGRLLPTLRQAALTTDPFRIALLDTTLPGADWEELGQRIAADAELRSTALVLMCGFGRQCGWAKLKSRGFAGHLFKPVGERNLYAALAALATPGECPVPLPARADLPARAASPQHARKILVAEDNLTNQEVALAILSKLGYRPQLAADGLEALQALRESDFDIVLMDCEMPGMDGYEAARQIRNGRAGTRNPQIPIVALTADAISGDRERCLQAGMNDYLAKPVEPRQLAAVLDKWMGEANEVRHLGSGEEPLAPPPTLFQPADLLARLGDDKDLARKIVAGFLRDVPGQLPILRQRLDQGDAPGVRLLAHALKGAAATVAAPGLRALFREMQEAAAGGNLSAAAALMPRLEEQFERFKSALARSEWA